MDRTPLNLCPDPEDDAETRWRRREAFRKKAEAEGHWVAARRCGVPPFFSHKKAIRKDFADNKPLLESIDHVLSGEGLFVFGGMGVGKTHLAAAIAIELLRGHVEARRCSRPSEESPWFLPLSDDPTEGVAVYPKRTLEFWSVPDLFGRIRDAISRENRHSVADLIDGCRDCEVLFLDDLGAHKSTEWAEETLFRVVDGRHGQMRPTVFTSNYSLEDLIPRVGARVVDRIAEVCRVVRMTGENRRKRP